MLHDGRRARGDDRAGAARARAVVDLHAGRSSSRSRASCSSRRATRRSPTSSTTTTCPSRTGSCSGRRTGPSPSGGRVRRGRGAARRRPRRTAVRARVLDRRADVPRVVRVHRPAPDDAAPAGVDARRRDEEVAVPRGVPHPARARGHARDGRGRTRSGRAVLARHRVRPRGARRERRRVRGAHRAVRRRRGASASRALQRAARHDPVAADAARRGRASASIVAVFSLAPDRCGSPSSAPSRSAPPPPSRSPSGMGALQAKLDGPHRVARVRGLPRGDPHRARRRRGRRPGSRASSSARCTGRSSASSSRRGSCCCARAAGDPASRSAFVASVRRPWTVATRTEPSTHVTVAIVTDSAAALPADLVGALGRSRSSRCGSRSTGSRARGRAAARRARCEQPGVLTSAPTPGEFERGDQGGAAQTRTASSC